MTRATLILGLLLLAVPAAAQEGKDTSKPPAGEKPAEAKPDPTARFWEARRVMLAGRPKDAAELFRTLVSDYPKAGVADDCLYWAGRCWLRVDDREPDAVVAFKRLIETMPASPFVDDAARELRRLGDQTMVPVLAKRLDGTGAVAELAARALAEFDDARGVDWLAARLGEKQEAAPAAPAASGSPRKAKKADETKTESPAEEVEELRAEVKRLRRELEESVKLLEKLLAEKAAEGKAEKPAPEPEKEEKPDPESETKK